LVAKAKPSEEDEQQRTDAERDDIDPLPAPIDNGCSPSTDNKLRGDEQGNDTTGSIAKPMDERGEQHPSPRVIEDSGVEKRAGNCDEEEACVVGEHDGFPFLSGMACIRFDLDEFRRWLATR
jgi:hypothetical protein